MRLLALDLGTRCGWALFEGAERVASGTWCLDQDPGQVAVAAEDGETLPQLEARACARLDELESIAETVAQPWPRLDGEVPSPAECWLAESFVDAEVVAWLEAGVPWATSAAHLRQVGITPRDVAREIEQGWSVGLIFARDEMSLAEVQRLALGEDLAARRAS